MRTSIDFGIDLGTTNSAIARQVGIKPVLIDGPERSPLLPSTVHVRADGQLLVGAAARALLSRDPANTALEFKRLMGTEEKRAFPASGKSLSPEELSAEVLRELVRWGSVAAGERLEAAVITVPAMFQLPQCEATRRAAALAGIRHAPLLQEPIAAAIAHTGSGEMGDGQWLVYDLGGGTFDVSLVESKRGRLIIKDHDGDNHLGGKDLDRALARLAEDRVRAAGKHGEFRRADPAHADARSRLKTEAERVRLALSSTEQAAFEVPDVVGFAIDRGELEALLTPILLRTTDLCAKVLERGRLTGRELKGLVLVGGPTLTPCVPRLIQEKLGVEARHRADPFTIVAAGAAIFAATQRPPRQAGARSSSAVELQLEFQAMTTSLAPLLAGKLDPKAAGAGWSLHLREAEGFSAALPVSPQGTFAGPLQLRKNALNLFAVELRDAAGKPVAAEPSEITIVHGLSVGKPPLSQSVGVVLADDAVAWYLRKGTSLPTRNTMTHTTTMSLKRGQSADAVNVPVVQGESERGGQNKLIGMLRIHAEKIARDLPAGSEVAVTVTVDEFSRTDAKAYVPLLDQWFEEVIYFRLETKAPEEVQQGLTSQKERLEKLAAELEKTGGGAVDQRVKEIEQLIEDGDRDSVDRADSIVRKLTHDLDGVERAGKAQGLEERFGEQSSFATEVLAALGKPAEREQLKALSMEFKGALARGNSELAQRKSDELFSLTQRALMRDIGFWRGVFADLCKRAKELGLDARAPILAGQKADKAEDLDGLARACFAIIELLPREEQAKHGSILSHLR